MNIFFFSCSVLIRMFLQGATGGNEEEREIITRGSVKDEHLLERKCLVERMKGATKKKIHFQLNKKWSVYSDEAPSARGMETTFDVITICRSPSDEARKMKNPPKDYKMSIPLNQVGNIYILIHGVKNSFVQGEKPCLENLAKCTVHNLEHTFNLDLLSASHYPPTLFEADMYDAKVSFYFFSNIII